MADVSETGGTGNARQQIYAYGGTPPGAVESSAGATQPGRSPALENMPKASSGPCKSSALAPAEALVDPSWIQLSSAGYTGDQLGLVVRQHTMEGRSGPSKFSAMAPAEALGDPSWIQLSIAGYTLDQLGPVVRQHTMEGLEALVRTHVQVSRVLPESQHESCRKELAEIACQADGIEVLYKVLYTLSRHWDTSSNHSNPMGVLNLAKGEFGAMKVASLANLLEDGFTYKQLVEVMKQHGSGVLVPLSAAANAVPTASYPDGSPQLPARLLEIARRDDGMAVLNAVTKGRQALTGIASDTEVLDMAAQPGGVARLTEIVAMADARRVLENSIRDLMREAARRN